MNLTDEQKELYLLYKKSKDNKLRDKYRVLILFKSGKTKKELSEFFFVDENTIASWISRWEKQKEVNDKKRSGRPSKLTKEEIDELCEIVDENNPEKYGFNLSVWDCLELSKLCKQRFEKEISSESIRKILIKEGFTYKKIDYFFVKQNPEQREQHINNIIEFYNNEPEDYEIYFSDEMSAKLHSKQNYVWSREKKTILKTECSHAKIIVTGGVNIMSGNAITTVSEKNDADAFINFIKEIDKNKEKPKVIVYIDNYPVHYAKKVQDFMKTKPHIELRYAPKYSPDLNPQEWFWAYLRKKCLNCYVVNSKEELKNWILQFCSKIEREVVKSVCSFKIFENKYVYSPN